MRFQYRHWCWYLCTHSWTKQLSAQRGGGVGGIEQTREALVSLAYLTMRDALLAQQLRTRGFFTIAALTQRFTAILGCRSFPARFFFMTVLLGATSFSMRVLKMLKNDNVGNRCSGPCFFLTDCQVHVLRNELSSMLLKAYAYFASIFRG